MNREDEVQTLRRVAIIVAVLAGCWTAGCPISRHIVDVTPPPNQPPLQELEQHLEYTDPDAGQPDYVRTQ